jgi:hypothetical protein
MISMCGLVCSECPAYLATQAGDEDRVREIAAQWSKEFGSDVRPEHVWCDGCLAEGRKCGHCAQCEIRACGTKRGVSTCAACADYGCKILSAFHEMVPQARQVLDSLRG